MHVVRPRSGWAYCSSQSALSIVSQNVCFNMLPRALRGRWLATRNVSVDDACALVLVQAHAEDLEAELVPALHVLQDRAGT